MKDYYMIDYISLEGTEYPIRDLRLAEYEVNVKIAGESLEKIIFDADGNYTSRESQLLDELIFFYVPDDLILNASDDEADRYVTDNLKWL